MASPKIVEWHPLPEILAPQARVLAAELGLWDRTPYRGGWQAMGIGVDCVRFVAAILDAMRRRKTDIKTLPDDTALHSRETAIEGMLRLRRALEPNAMIPPEAGVLHVEPGDILVTGPTGGGPGHAMIVGCRQNVLWEASNLSVRRVGLSGLRRKDTVCYYAFRPTDKAAWRTE